MSYNKEIKDIVLELIKTGLGTRKICKQTGVPRNTIQRWCRSAGIDISKRQHLHHPIPTHKICKRCPENGLQSINEFRKHSRGNGSYSYRYCKECDRKLSNKRMKIRNNKLSKLPEFRLTRSLRATMAYSMKSNNVNEFGKLRHLDYTVKQLKNHIENLFESWMNWNNYGKYNPKTWDNNNSSTWVWQIDHIIPQSKLSFKSIKDENFKKCWALDNLRPYSAKQNILDSNKRT